MSVSGEIKGEVVGVTRGSKDEEIHTAGKSLVWKFEQKIKLEKSRRKWKDKVKINFYY